MPRIHSDQNVDQKIVEMRKSGATARQIIKELRVHSTRVTRVLAESGLGNGKLTDNQKGAILTMHNAGHSNADIARTIPCSKTTVTNVLKSGGRHAKVDRSLRAIRVEGDVAYVPLTKGMEAVIDADDIGKISTWGRWWTMQTGKYPYAQASTGGIRVLMHRMLMDAPDDKVVDHINGNTLDNRRANLRVVTVRENAYNQEAHRNGDDVGIRAENGKWAFFVSYRQGGFETAEEAADARAAFLKKLQELGAP